MSNNKKTNLYRVLQPIIDQMLINEARINMQIEGCGIEAIDNADGTITFKISTCRSDGPIYDYNFD